MNDRLRRATVGLAVLFLMFGAGSCGSPDPLPSVVGAELLAGPSGTERAPSGAGPLRLKAIAHDLWVEQWHTPNYGSHLHVRFTDSSKSDVDAYYGHGDSCIWTGTYVASQALRYSTTGEPQARENVIRSSAALSRHLHITGRPGFIARYAGPATDPGHRYRVAECASDEDCHFVTEGKYAGDFWIGNTSRDQYTGWFLGMAWAYDLVDDQVMRARIRTDVAIVLDRLIADRWRIIDVDGKPTTKAPNVLPPMQMAWAIIGYHITGEDRFLNVFEGWAAEEKRGELRSSNISIINRYAQHYGLNLAHENFLSLLRLSRPYPEAHAFIEELFHDQTHRWVDLQHNPWYTAVYMAEGDVTDPARRQAHRDQIVQDLTDFPDAPKEQYAMFPPEARLDPLSVFLSNLQQKLPWLADIMGEVEPQALEAYPVKHRCSSGFIFQRSMWEISCSVQQDDPSFVNSGHDYLAAYWLASAYGVLEETD